MGVVAAAVDAPPVAPGELERRFVELRDGDAATRLKVAQSLAQLPAGAVEVLAERLLRPRATRPEVFRRLVLAIWGQVPNWKASDPMWIQKPEPPWTPPPRVKGQPRAKRPPPHDPEKVDWIAALNELD